MSDTDQPSAVKKNYEIVTDGLEVLQDEVLKSRVELEEFFKGGQ